MSPRADDYGPCATRSEKAAAFNALTPEDYGRLLKFAEFVARKFTGRVRDSDWEDLFQETIARALDERNWYPKKADFLTWLRGCIRSIASGWYKSAKTAELPDEVPSPARHDAQTEAAIMLEKIRETLRARPHAVEIFDLKCSRLTAKEIQNRLGISAKVYAAAVKWIDRTLREEGFRQ